MTRAHGAEQPGIHAGIFTIRIPFIHYRIERVELFEGVIMCAACMSAIPLLQQILEIPYEIAWSMVIINGILYNLHSLLGDPVSPGWITPAIPVTTAYLLIYPAGPERIKALVALQILVAAIFLFMGITKLAHKIVRTIPVSIKSGILLGAGFSAVFGEFTTGGRVSKYPYAVIIGSIVMFFVIYSTIFVRLRAKHKFANIIANWGMVPAFLTAIIVGPLAGEIKAPSFTLGTVFKLPNIPGILENTIFKVGFPGIPYFSAGLATAIIIYIIAFGDFVTADALVAEAKEVRPDEFVDLNANRSNLVCGIRNLVSAFFNPYPNMCGPMWSGSYAMIIQRYKEGRKSMDGLCCGAGTFRFATLLGVMLYPVNGLLQNSLPVALSMMMLLQGYVCVNLAMGFCETTEDKGIAGIMGAVLAAKGSLWGLIVGFGLYFLLVGIRKNRKQAD